MAAFERIQSGIPEMDQALDNIRLGDNVVWQVTNLEEFRYFVNPFVKQALAESLEICPEYEELKDMIEVCILEEGSRLYYDMESEQAVLQI